MSDTESNRTVELPSRRLSDLTERSKETTESAVQSYIETKNMISKMKNELQWKNHEIQELKSELGSIQRRWWYCFMC